jgi:hypothetical protein
MNTELELTEPTLELQRGWRLLLEREPGNDRLILVRPDGTAPLVLEIGSHGPVLRLAGNVSLETNGDFRLKARNLELQADEKLTVTSGGAVQVNAAGDFVSQARQQHITADLGNVNVKANDDVRINGERILMNC